MRFANCLLVGFVCLLLVSIGCSSSDDVMNPVTPPVVDGACSNPPGVNNRFVDCGNGTVTDTQTGLIWLKNANCLVPQDWDRAMASAAGLKSGDCGLTDNSFAGQWHLPTADCVQGGYSCALSDATGEFPGIVGAPCTATPYVLNTAGTGCWTEGNLFSGVLAGGYWSISRTYTNLSNARGVNLNSGGLYNDAKSELAFFWPVRN